jgi:hypothetical protein
MTLHSGCNPEMAPGFCVMTFMVTVFVLQLASFSWQISARATLYFRLCSAAIVLAFPDVSRSLSVTICRPPPSAET